MTISKDGKRKKKSRMGLHVINERKNTSKDIEEKRKREMKGRMEGRERTLKRWNFSFCFFSLSSFIPSFMLFVC